MQINVTEHKSKGTLHPIDTLVRVFVNQDYHYGYFVSEHLLFEHLTPEQQTAYLEGDSALLEVAPETAQKLIDAGHTPYAKVRVT